MDEYLSAFETNLAFACGLYINFLLFKSISNDSNSDNCIIKTHKLVEFCKEFKDINSNLYEKLSKEYSSDNFHRCILEEFLNMNTNIFANSRYLYVSISNINLIINVKIVKEKHNKVKHMKRARNTQVFF